MHLVNNTRNTRHSWKHTEIYRTTKFFRTDTGITGGGRASITADATSKTVHALLQLSPIQITLLTAFLATPSHLYHAVSVPPAERSSSWIRRPHSVLSVAFSGLRRSARGYDPVYS